MTNEELEAIEARDRARLADVQNAKGRLDRYWREGDYPNDVADVAELLIADIAACSVDIPKLVAEVRRLIALETQRHNSCIAELLDEELPE